MKKYEGSFWSKNLHKWPKIGQNAQQVHLLAQKGLFRTEMVKMTQHKKIKMKNRNFRLVLTS